MGDRRPRRQQAGDHESGGGRRHPPHAVLRTTIDGTEVPTTNTD